MKTTTVAVIAGLALGLGTSLATAHPTGPTKNLNNSKKLGLTKADILLESPAAEDFSDNFDSYETGSTIVGQGGWELWYTGGKDGTLRYYHSLAGIFTKHNVRMANELERTVARMHELAGAMGRVGLSAT